MENRLSYSKSVHAYYRWYYLRYRNKDGQATHATRLGLNFDSAAATFWQVSSEYQNCAVDQTLCEVNTAYRGNRT